MAGVAEGWACAFDKFARDTLLNGYEFSLRVEDFCRESNASCDVMSFVEERRGSGGSLKWVWCCRM